MFESFFPKPKVFFLSCIAFAVMMMLGWYQFSEGLRGLVGLDEVTPADNPVIGLGHFVTDEFLFFYLYVLAGFGIFSAAWFTFCPHPWQRWSVVGSGVLIFSVYYSVQVSVAINNWRRPFFDSVQNALTEPNVVTQTELYELILIFAQIAFVAVFIFAGVRFFSSHYVFRWRTAMNNYYMERWQRLRNIEGASQRVQEDTKRFAEITEDLGLAIVDSVMTLIAFLPILWALSIHVDELPIVGSIPAPLVQAAIFWSLFGTVLLAVAGIRLPGLHFRNQRVEATYRKELVYGEDDEERASPPTVRELFGIVRKNYFNLYFHYMYFNVFRSMYIQADNIFAYIILVPTIAAGKITFGILQQILTAFGQVSNSFQFLVNSWTTIVELLSIHKRLAAFERAMRGEEQADIEREGDTRAI